MLHAVAIRGATRTGSNVTLKRANASAPGDSPKSLSAMSDAYPAPFQRHVACI